MTQPQQRKMKYPRSTKTSHRIQKKMPLVVRDEEVAGPDNETNAPKEQGRARPARNQIMPRSNDFIMKELLDVNKEPQKSPGLNQSPDRGPQREISAFQLMEEEMMEGLTSVSQAGSTASRMSKPYITWII
jgi:hypothetical protein